MSEQLSGRDLAWLERRRAELFGLISQAGDFRRGALNAVWRKYGKPGCACAQPGHRGHGPQYNLTRRIGGKTVTVHLEPARSWRRPSLRWRAPAVHGPGGGGDPRSARRFSRPGRSRARGGPSCGGAKGGFTTASSTSSGLATWKPTH